MTWTQRSELTGYAEQSIPHGVARRLQGNGLWTWPGNQGVKIRVWDAVHSEHRAPLPGAQTRLTVQEGSSWPLIYLSSGQLFWLQTSMGWLLMLFFLLFLWLWWDVSNLLCPETVGLENKTESSSETIHGALFPASRRFWDSEAAFACCAACKLRQQGQSIGGIVLIL